MNADTPLSLTHFSAPQADRVGWGQMTFAIVAAPLAWFILVCAGEALANEACFPYGPRLRAPLAGLEWTWPALIALLIACVLVSLAAILISWKMYRVTCSEEGGKQAGLLDEGVGRTRFMALWGLLYSVGFCAATLFSVASYWALPRCGG